MPVGAPLEADLFEDGEEERDTINEEEAFVPTQR